MLKYENPRKTSASQQGASWKEMEIRPASVCYLDSDGYPKSRISWKIKTIITRKNKTDSLYSGEELPKIT